MASALAVTLAAGACATPKKSGSGDAPGGDNAKFKVCYAVDVGGINDGGYYQLGYQAVEQAKKQLGVTHTYLTATGAQDYVPMINTFVGQDCASILAIGSVFSPAVEQAAKANPDQKFILVDAAFTGADGKQVSYPNVANLLFKDEQPSFLAGYLSAGISKTGVVGVWGGMNIPPVVTHFYGFQAGVEHYNAQHSKSVKLIGWDSATGQGTFTGSFADQQGGRSVTEQQIAQKADIIFSAGGQSSLGMVAAAQDHPGTLIIWADVDTCDNPQLAKSACPIQLTATMKRLDVAILQVLKSQVDNQFKGGVQQFGLDSEAVGLGPFNHVTVPAELQSELKQVTDDINAGKIAPRSGK
jgi:basic membrane protein A